MACPEWIKAFLGKNLLRSCPSRKTCSNVHCHLRVLCNCAADDLAAASKVEMRVWIVLLACGLAGILYWFLGQ